MQHQLEKRAWTIEEKMFVFGLAYVTLNFILFILFSAVWFADSRPLTDTAELIFSLLFSGFVGFTVLCALVTLAYLKYSSYTIAHASGSLVLDCGTQPIRWFNIVSDILIAVLLVYAGVTTDSALYISFAVLFVSFLISNIYAGMGHLQIRERGIVSSGYLWRWEDIQDYSRDGSRAFLIMKTWMPFKKVEFLRIPLELADAFDASCREHQVPKAG